MSRKGQSCSNCHFSRRDLKSGDWTCQEDSPYVQILVMPTKNDFTGQTEMLPQPHSCWPFTKADEWCGKWKMDEDIEGVARA